MAKKKSKDLEKKVMKPQASFAEMVSDAQIAKLQPLVQQMVYQAISPIAQQQMNQYAELVTRVLILQDILKEKFDDVTDEEIERRTEEIIRKSQEDAEAAKKAKELAEEAVVEEPTQAKTEDYFPVKEEVAEERALEEGKR